MPISRGGCRQSWLCGTATSVSRERDEARSVHRKRTTGAFLLTNRPDELNGHRRTFVRFQCCWPRRHAPIPSCAFPATDSTVRMINCSLNPAMNATAAMTAPFACSTGRMPACRNA